MEVMLTNYAEQAAEKAEALPAFSGLKLLHIKREISELLGQIGKTGFFANYTKHDISHIDAMLNMLDWLVPDDTKTAMTPADWLMIVLAIYFHDLGMFVSNEEYKSRDDSAFPRFRDDVLYAKDEGLDYRDRLKGLSDDDRERFLYEEYVRHNHAQRVRGWLTGRPSVKLGAGSGAAAEVGRLVCTLDHVFRRDLGFVCESHHLNDLNDLKKYSTSQPYGNSDQETANLQYAAVLLRTADLLHITRDRTPPIMFRVLNPADPVSQQEWAKQMAVRRVRAQVARNKDGAPDEALPKDTIEVHAHFTKEDGFFGLNSYLRFASEQLGMSYRWVEDARKQNGTKHRFPWRRIDDSHIETEGFLKQSFEFTLDQAKILDLLTGHTLYNDTSVVVRELVQNSLDAIKLQRVIDKAHGAKVTEGSVNITWNSRTRVLTVKDNGTGMTQRDIEHHLLKVGSSKYQDAEFRKQYPGFSAISRFGIGVLSAFMVADSVEILTCHPEEAEGRQLTLRSVHGRYLIRLLAKESDPMISPVLPHGTSVTLRIRPSAPVDDILATLNRWIVIPDSRVSVSIDGGPAIKVGFDSPKDAVANALRQLNMPFDENADRKHWSIRIEEATQDGVTLAYAVRWSEYYQEWSFERVPKRAGGKVAEVDLGTCVEGIRVESETPGYRAHGIVAIANATGSMAPKTNVARSGIEATPERERLLQTIYRMFCAHVRKELEDLHAERSFSLTWAAEEARWLVRALRGDEAADERLLASALRDLPMVLVEEGGERKTMSASALAKVPRVWTAHSAFFSFAERLLREASGGASLSRLMSGLSISTDALPEGILVCHGDDYVESGEAPFAEREVTRVDIHRDQRRVDLCWEPRDTATRWVSYDVDMTSRYTVSPLVRQILIGTGPVEVKGRRDELAIQAFGRIFIFEDTAIAKLLLPWVRDVGTRRDERSVFISALMGITPALLAARDVIAADEIQRELLRNSEIPAEFDAQALAAALVGRDKVFDVSAWSRRTGIDTFF